MSVLIQVGNPILEAANWTHDNPGKTIVGLMAAFTAAGYISAQVARANFNEQLLCALPDAAQIEETFGTIECD